MKRKDWPIWLLRDVPAFLGIKFRFWPLVILLITSARRAVREKTIRQSFYDDLPLMLAHAEARLASALRRQSYRRLGWNPRLVKFNIALARDDSVERHRKYSNAIRDMDAVVDGYIADIRKRCRIREPEAVSASARAPVRAPLATLTKSSLAARRGGGSPRLRGETEGAACALAHTDRLYVQL
ncbi:MAG: hypothetical protein ABMA14_14550 [Hyphomonadaceae bacterium]